MPGSRTTRGSCTTMNISPRRYAVNLIAGIVLASALFVRIAHTASPGAHSDLPPPALTFKAPPLTPYARSLSPLKLLDEEERIGRTANRAEQLYNQGAYDEARAVAQDALKRKALLQGDSGIGFGGLYHTLALLAERDGNNRLAEKYFAITLSDFESMPFGDFKAVSVLIDRALLYDAHLRFKEAEHDLTRAQAYYERTLGTGESDLLITVLNNLGIVYTEEGRFAEAEPLLRRVLLYYEADPRNQLAIHDAVMNLGDTYFDAGQYETALPLQERALSIAQALWTSNSMGALAEYPSGEGHGIVGFSYTGCRIPSDLMVSMALSSVMPR